MKFAIIFTIIAVVTAEPPQFDGFQRQSAPYSPRGWRPAGPSFDLPQRQQSFAAPQNTYGAPQQQQNNFQRQQSFPAPQTAYGAPQQQQNYIPPKVEYGPPEPDAINVETTTAAEEVTTLRPAKLVEEVPKTKSEKLEEPKPQNPVFLIVPQPEKLVYTVQQSAPLVAVPETKILANLQTVPVGHAALATSYYTPTYSSSFVQIYQ